MSRICLYDPNRTIHYRLEGKHARPLCKCKLLPGIRPKMLSRLGGDTLPLPKKPDGEGVWTGTCSSCYEIAQRLMAPRMTPPVAYATSQYERDRRTADAAGFHEADFRAAVQTAKEKAVQTPELMHPATPTDEGG